MFSIYNTAKTLLAKAEIDIPVLLYEAGELDDFAVYKIGSSRNAKEKGLFIFLNDGLLSYPNHNLGLIVHLQLFKVEEEESMQYQDVVKNFLFNVKPELLGFDMFDRIEFDSYYNVQERVGFSYFMPYWTNENSDCDIR